MNINGLGVNKVTSIYTENSKKVTEKRTSEVKNDSVQISSLGKSLNTYSLDDNFSMSAQNIEKLKAQVSNGTYKPDTSAIASKMMNTLKGEI